MAIAYKEYQKAILEFLLAKALSEEGLESVMEQLWERAYRYGYLDGRSSLLDDSHQE
jgi:hypothetical protein